MVDARWDFEGAGSFATPGECRPVDGKRSQVTLQATHSFATPGTYFSTLHAVSQRESAALTPYARIHNLGRVRVVVG